MPQARLHHLNCGTMCPRGGRFLGGTGGVLATARLVCHVLLLEQPDGLILVDTGFGTGDVQNPRQLSLPFNAIVRPQLSVADTALWQLRGRGFKPDDVRHVVLTHLDVDHAGGLPDFPAADVHLLGREHEAMLRPPLRERRRYAIGRPHWAHGPRWITHEPAGDTWHGFESVRVIPGTDPEILLVPLTGHSLGHAGVAVSDGEAWLLHCGDAFFHHGEVETPRRCPPGLRAFQTLVQADGKTRHANQERLRELARREGETVRLICSHDPRQLEESRPA
jgi:glyoxylase-like metal-dependent hydrolase (beta-lactamase superfamily II)